MVYVRPARFPAHQRAEQQFPGRVAAAITTSGLSFRVARFAAALCSTATVARPDNASHAETVPTVTIVPLGGHRLQFGRQPGYRRRKFRFSLDNQRLRCLLGYLRYPRQDFSGVPSVVIVDSGTAAGKHRRSDLRAHVGTAWIFIRRLRGLSQGRKLQGYVTVVPTGTVCSWRSWPRLLPGGLIVWGWRCWRRRYLHASTDSCAESKASHADENTLWRTVGRCESAIVYRGTRAIKGERLAYPASV